MWQFLVSPLGPRLERASRTGNLPSLTAVASQLPLPSRKHPADIRLVQYARLRRYLSFLQEFHSCVRSVIVWILIVVSAGEAPVSTLYSF